jgi:hypothetical protein
MTKLMSGRDDVKNKMAVKGVDMLVGCQLLSHNYK